MKKTFQKIRATLSLNGIDWSTFKGIAREERTTPSVLVGQFIHNYILKKGEKENA